MSDVGGTKWYMLFLTTILVVLVGLECPSRVEVGVRYGAGMCLYKDDPIFLRG